MPGRLALLYAAGQGRRGNTTLVRQAAEALRRAGLQADVLIRHSKLGVHRLLPAMVDWQAMDLSQYHGVVAFNLPAACARHPKRYVLLLERQLQLYEWFGSNLSPLSHNSRDDRLRSLLISAENRCLSGALQVRTLSQTTADRLEYYLGIKAQPLRLPSPWRSHIQPGQAADYLLCPGGFTKRHRPHLLLALLRALPDSLPAVVLDLEGDGSRWSALSMEDKLRDRVQVLTAPDDTTLADVYGRALAVVALSLDDEQGYGVMNACYAQKPAYALDDCGAATEWIEPGITGAVCTSIDHMASRIRALIAAGRISPGMREAAGQRVAGLSFTPLVTELRKYMPGA